MNDWLDRVAFRTNKNVVRGFHCPVCKAEKGQPCLLRTGEPIKVHRKRWNLAEGRT